MSSKIHRESEPPKWVRIAALTGMCGTFGGFLTSAVYSGILKHHKKHEVLSAFEARIVLVGVISLGFTIAMGVIISAYAGSIYSGFRRGDVSRTEDPAHFWSLLGVVACIAIFILVWGVHQFITVR